MFVEVGYPISSVASFRPGCNVCSLNIQYISLLLRHSNRLIVDGDIKSIGVTVYGFSVSRCCVCICLETLCCRKPCLILDRCLLILACNFCVVLPMYCVPHTHSSRYITYCIWQFRWYLMSNFSPVHDETNSFLSWAISPQHKQQADPHRKLPFVSRLSFSDFFAWCLSLLGAITLLIVGALLNVIKVFFGSKPFRSGSFCRMNYRNYFAEYFLFSHGLY